ncbi:MAG: DUF362 domain-containing protein [Dehalococcoidia bacterium]|nr:DUF362 domain-containing protein [Dehalococcoidia bacterium]
MNRSRVALVRCENYDPDAIYQAAVKGLDLIGGISNLVRSGERIVLKPNVLYGTNPEKGISTHPAVFRAVGKILQESGARVSYGDSPSFAGAEGHLRRCGLKQVADEMGIELADFDKGRTVSHKDGLLIKSFVLANGVLDSDGVVNLPKLKTHPLTRLTGAVKNQFGCIPGLLKSQYHVKLPDPYDFATMLVDLNTLVRPRFCVMDGIVAMEGNGPRSGRLRKLDVLLFSTDPVALDATACRIINLDPEIATTSKPGEKAGLGTYHSENIELVGEGLESFFCRDFDVIRTPQEHCTQNRIMAFVKNRVCERPVIAKAKCTGCGMCVKMCPVDPKAVDWRKGDREKPPVHDYDRCIRCYCCQESCPEGAISARGTVLGRTFFRH